MKRSLLLQEALEKKREGRYIVSCCVSGGAPGGGQYFGVAKALLDGDLDQKELVTPVLILGVGASQFLVTSPWMVFRRWDPSLEEKRSDFLPDISGLRLEQNQRCFDLRTSVTSSFWQEKGCQRLLA